jgi:hypothetical protein
MSGRLVIISVCHSVGILDTDRELIAAKEREHRSGEEIVEKRGAERDLIRAARYSRL